MASNVNAEFPDLMRRVANGRDQAAFTVLFDFFAPRIKSYLMKLGLNDMLAEENTQEVMIILWHRASQYDPAKAALSTWLFQIARNRRIDALRRDKSSLIDLNDPMLVPEPPLQQDREYEDHERDTQVRDSMKGLPTEQSELVRMAFFLGKSHSEISADTGLPLGTVKSRIRLAFRHLRQHLEIAGLTQV